LLLNRTKFKTTHYLTKQEIIIYLEDREVAYFIRWEGKQPRCSMINKVHKNVIIWPTTKTHMHMHGLSVWLSNEISQCEQCLTIYLHTLQYHA